MINILDQLIKAVCPIDGVSVGNKNDKNTWRIDYKDTATAAERLAAQAVVDAFDFAAEEQRIVELKIGEENYKAMVRRRAEELVAQGLQVDALIMLKTIGE